MSLYEQYGMIKSVCECGNDTFRIYRDGLFTIKNCAKCGKREAGKKGEDEH